MSFNPILYNEKYRIPTSRLKNRNYGKGLYHIVLCTKERKYYFGDIRDNEMHYSSIGTFTKECIEGLNKYYPFAMIETYQVMPNHIHLLISLSEKAPVASIGETARNATVETAFLAVSKGNAAGETAKNAVSTGRHQSGLAILVAGLKRTITFWAKNNRIEFAWQTRYYDTIIRNITQFNDTNDYIHNNVINWIHDEMNAEYKDNASPTT